MGEVVPRNDVQNKARREGVVGEALGIRYEVDVASEWRVRGEGGEGVGECKLNGNESLLGRAAI